MNMFDKLRERQVIIYGAGKVGRVVIERMLFDGFRSSIIAIAVTEKKNNPERILGIPVMCSDELISKALKCVVIIATMEDKHQEIKKHLQKLEFRNIYYINDELYKKWNSDIIHSRYIYPYVHILEQLHNEHMICEQTRDRLEENMLLNAGNQGKVDIPRLVIVLGTKCSLKCKECNNLMPHFKPQKDLDKNKLIQALEIILDNAQTILICELIGGEPFLSNNLKDIIERLINKKNIFQIEVTTNGTIIPQTSLIYFLQNPKVKVRISDYGKLVNKNKLISFLKKNNINYEVLKLEVWVSSGGVKKRERSIKQLRSYYKNCFPGYYCKTLFDGKIFSCARAASLYALGYMKEKEFITIEEKMNSNVIREFWMQDYSEACDYCDAGCERKKLIEPAEQIKEILE